MKKTFLSFALLVIAFLGHSQNTKIKFGVQAGLNYSNFRGYTVPPELNSVYSESPAFAYLGGIHFEYPLKEHLSVRIEVNYERKSQQAKNIIEIVSFEQASRTYPFTTKKKYDYLVLPLLLKYHFTDKNSFYVNGGPFIGYLLKSTFTSDLHVPEFNTVNKDDTTNNNKRTDFGLSLGFGKHFELDQKSTLSLELRENLGLSNTTKVAVWDSGNVKTNSINFIIGYSLN